MSNVSANYLRDFWFVLREQALQANAHFHASSGTESAAFANGQYFAYYEVLSLMLSQAAVFGLAPAQLSLRGLNPDKDLLG